MNTHWSSSRSRQSFRTQGWTCHLSDDVKFFASSFKSSGGSLDFKRFMEASQDRYWVILNDAEFKLFQQHHVLQVPLVKESSHQLSWKLDQCLADSVYHMIYITVAHCTPHGSPLSSVNLTTNCTIVSGVTLDSHLRHWGPEDLSGIKSLNLRQQTQGHLRLSAFMVEIMVFRSQTPLFGVSGGRSELAHAESRLVL